MFCSSKTKLKVQNNSVFGMAIEKQGRITTSGMCLLIKIHKYIATAVVHQFKTWAILITLFPWFRSRCFREVFILSTKNTMCLIYRVISSPVDSSAGTRNIVCAYPKFCVMQYLDKVKLSTKDREGYKGHENLWVFLQYQ